MKHLWLMMAMVISCGISVSAQKKSPAKSKKPATTPVQSELAQLRDRYIATTKEYKASLQKLLTLYEDSLKKAEQRHENSQKLFDQGLISQRDLDESARIVTDAKLKISTVQQEIAGADTQIAQALVEIETEKQVKKLGLRRGGLVQTTSFIRFNGAGHWLLEQASSIESFFQQTFKRPLPIAVFGQGAIHNQWRLDHRNAMDISLKPDEPEGLALIDFLKRNGIPFSAFRGAIPGVATGPHIHIGMPSHRY
ncbi:MAG TPA: TolC family protein [Pyrinomonadaceae bacterium]|nr:TolC family protein [Pyrinomonadaceae bacterium]